MNQKFSKVQASVATPSVEDKLNVSLLEAER
jgi:hypothetical protein